MAAVHFFNKIDLLDQKEVAIDSFYMTNMSVNYRLGFVTLLDIMSAIFSFSA